MKNAIGHELCPELMKGLGIELKTEETCKDTATLQERLQKLGWLKGVNGQYDDATKQAVKNFQQYVNDVVRPSESLAVDGIVVVTSPQDLVSMIVTKAVNMAHMMNVPILGIVENYSYFQCPDCGKQHAIFGESNIEAVAAGLGIPVLAKLPMDPAVAAAFDSGKIEEFEPNYLTEVAAKLDK